ncbi:MAG TPA: septal ring lytic transglycosylase RlpA family protein [Phenylobacterium sp.]|nr:septal ring lytic transglycosylase RlpA family protein [Phenylobacterium sp.]
MTDRTGRGTARLAAVLMAGAALAACATVRPQYSTQARHAHPPSGAGGTYKVGAPYQVAGVWYVPKVQPNYDEEGVASWYGDAFQMKATADGEIFDKDAPSAAHTTLPLPSLVEVTNLDNGRRLVVRVNDRGPFIGGRIIDLSHEAARELGYDRAGLAHVRVRYVGPAPLYGEESRRYAQNTLTAQRPRVAAAAPPPPAAFKPATPAPAASDVILTAERLPKPPPMILETSLAPLTGEALPKIGPDAAPIAARVASAAATKGFRIQAGAFSTPENARKAMAQLAEAGPATVLPMTTKSGATLYRVVVEGAADPAQAEALRQKVAEAGFADAKVIKPF